MSRSAVALVISGALALAACGADTTAGSSADDSPLDGEFATLAGDTVDLAELRGQDVVLWFWAPW